ncbi:unnamed protein product [Peniophora sp. CBMAI 1063]|nr:unnamed protein product [Peniophora sp. CBMAI 1063]
MKSLTVYTYAGGPRHRDRYEATREIFDTVLKTTMGHLSILSISNLSLDWSLIRELRILRISFTASLSLQTVADALARCPRLQIFRYVEREGFRPDVSTVTTAISLPYLEALHIQGAVGICAGLLQSLVNTPRSLKIVISAYELSDVSPITSFASLVWDCAFGEDAPLIRLARISLCPAIFTIGDNALEPSDTRLGIAGHNFIPRSSQGFDMTGWYAAGGPDEYPNVGFETTTPISAEEEVLSGIFQSWTFVSATHLDLRGTMTLTSTHLDVLLANLPAVTTIMVRPEETHTLALIEYLRVHLVVGRRVLSTIIFDAEYVNRSSIEITQGNIAPSSTVNSFARQNVMQTLLLCADAARAGMPLDVIEIFNEPQDPTQRLIQSSQMTDWSELYEYLEEGFVYEGVLHSSKPEHDGAERDLFTNVDS